MAKQIAKFLSAGFLALVIALVSSFSGVQTVSAQASFNGVVEICTVTTDGLNVRSGPGTTNAISAPALNRGQKVIVLASQAGWARHGDGGWSSRQYLSCKSYTREQITQASLPKGYLLQANAVTHDGVRAPRYDAVTTPQGESWQPWIPQETMRQGHDVSLIQQAGDFTLLGVACFVEADVARAGDAAKRFTIASHQNDGEFTVSGGEVWLRVVCDESDVTGFSIVRRQAGTSASTNSPYGERNTFVANNEAGQFLMLSYDCVSDARLPEFDGVKEPNGDVWQPWLPSEATRSSQCFKTAVVLLEASFSFNGVACELYADERLEGVGTNGRLVAARGNGQLFSIDTYVNGVFDDKESWGVAVCAADPHNGFSIRRR